MRTSAPALLPLFRSRTQLDVLGTLYVGPAREWTVTELADEVGANVATVSREVVRLARAGIVAVRGQGRNKLVSANWNLSWAGPLAEVLDRTIGPLLMLADALADVAGLEEAWVFGSWAARYQGHPGHAPHDIDVIAVGDDLSQIALAKASMAVSERAGVDVNPIAVPTGKWAYPAPGSFVADVRAGPTVRVPVASNA
ncbi:MAG: winged helix-turn-helix domain-containing protein [Acidimicrobiales bacterium]